MSRRRAGKEGETDKPVYEEEVVMEVKPTGEVVKYEEPARVEEVVEVIPSAANVTTSEEKPVVSFEPAVQPTATTPLGELNVSVPESFFEGLVGVITNVGIRAFPALGTTALVVEITADDGKVYSEPLWVREVVGRRSKLGSFISALGKNPREWLGKRVRIVSWRQGARSIEVVREF